jgi:mRNA interferase MazF
METHRDSMVKRGDIVMVSLDPTLGSEQAKTRPAVVIQHDELNTYSNTTIIVPITSKVHKNYPMHVAIETGTIKVEQIRCIDTQRIKKNLGVVSHTTLQQIKTALLHVTDFY